MTIGFPHGKVLGSRTADLTPLPRSRAAEE